MKKKTKIVVTLIVMICSSTIDAGRRGRGRGFGKATQPERLEQMVPAPEVPSVQSRGELPPPPKSLPPSAPPGLALHTEATSSKGLRMSEGDEIEFREMVPGILVHPALDFTVEQVSGYADHHKANEAAMEYLKLLAKAPFPLLSRVRNDVEDLNKSAKWGRVELTSALDTLESAILKLNRKTREEREKLTETRVLVERFKHLCELISLFPTSVPESVAGPSSEEAANPYLMSEEPILLKFTGVSMPLRFYRGDSLVLDLASVVFLSNLNPRLASIRGGLELLMGDFSYIQEGNDKVGGIINSSFFPDVDYTRVLFLIWNAISTICNGSEAFPNNGEWRRILSNSQKSNKSVVAEIRNLMGWISFKVRHYDEKFPDLLKILNKLLEEEKRKVLEEKATEISKLEAEKQALEARDQKRSAYIERMKQMNKEMDECIARMEEPGTGGSIPPWLPHFDPNAAKPSFPLAKVIAPAPNSAVPKTAAPAVPANQQPPAEQQPAPGVPAMVVPAMVAPKTVAPAVPANQQPPAEQQPAPAEQQPAPAVPANQRQAPVRRDAITWETPITDLPGSGHAEYSRRVQWKVNPNGEFWADTKNILGSYVPVRMDEEKIKKYGKPKHAPDQGAGPDQAEGLEQEDEENRPNTMPTISNPAASGQVTSSADPRGSSQQAGSEGRSTTIAGLALEPAKQLKTSALRDSEEREKPDEGKGASTSDQQECPGAGKGAPRTDQQECPAQ